MMVYGNQGASDRCARSIFLSWAKNQNGGKIKIIKQKGMFWYPLANQKYNKRLHVYFVNTAL